LELIPKEGAKMIIGDNNINIFDEENESILGDLAAKYFVLKKKFADGTMEINVDGKIINGPPHDTNYMRAFEQQYKVEFEDLEAWLEVKDYFDNEWNNHIHNNMLDDFRKGAREIKQPK
jgi:hypothetical protein